LRDNLIIQGSYLLWGDYIKIQLYKMKGQFLFGDTKKLDEFIVGVTPKAFHAVSKHFL
jgi:hypothetical protein